MSDQADSEGTPGIPILRFMGPDESLPRLQSLGSASDSNPTSSAVEPTEAPTFSTASPYEPLPDETPSTVPTSQATVLFQQSTIEDRALGDFQFGTVDADALAPTFSPSPPGESAAASPPDLLTPSVRPPTKLSRAPSLNALATARGGDDTVDPAWEANYWYEQDPNLLLEGNAQFAAGIPPEPMLYPSGPLQNVPGPSLPTLPRGTSLLPNVRRESAIGVHPDSALPDAIHPSSSPLPRVHQSNHVTAAFDSVRSTQPQAAQGPTLAPFSAAPPALPPHPDQSANAGGVATWRPGDLLLARFATHDLVDRNGVRLAIPRNLWSANAGSRSSPAAVNQPSPTPPDGYASISSFPDVSAGHQAEYERLLEERRRHLNPTTEGFMESLYGPFLAAMTEKQRQEAWHKCEVLRRQHIAATVSEQLYRVPRPSAEQMSTAAHASLFEGRYANAAYRVLSPPMEYAHLKQQTYAESRMDQAGRFTPLAGTGNAASPIQGGLLRPGYRPSPAEIRQLAEQAADSLSNTVRPAFSVGDANKVLGRHKGTFDGWQTVDPRSPKFDQVGDIEKFVNSLKSKDVFVYVAAMLKGKIALKYNDYDRLSHDARKVVDAAARFRSQLRTGERILVAPTLFAEILDGFESQCPGTFYDCDAELAGCIDVRLRGEMWEKSSATIKQSIFKATGDNTFVECIVLWLNAPFVRYNPADCVKQLEQLVRQPKPVAMAPDEFHRLFTRRLEQHRYANQGHPMFPSEQKTMACLVEAYGQYDHYKSLFQTMETLCRLQNTVAPWQPESTYNWTVQDLMLHIEKHRDESLDFNPLVQAPTAVGSSKAVNAVSMSFEDFKKRWTQSQSTRSAGPESAGAPVPKASDGDKKAKEQERRKAQMIKNISNRVDADGKCKFCKKPMPACGPGTGTSSECIKCKQCARSCQHTADRCPYHTKGKYFGKFENGEVSRPWNTGHTCPKCKDKHDHDPADCQGTKHEESIQLQKKLLAGNTGFRGATAPTVKFNVNAVQAGNDEDCAEAATAWKAFEEMAKDCKMVGGLLKADSLAKLLCAQPSAGLQEAMHSFVLFDPGAEVSMHNSPVNSVGRLMVKPNVTLSGIFGGESGSHQGCCAQRLDTKDHEGKITSLVVPESYYCPTARVNLLSGADWKKGKNHFVDCGTDVFLMVADKRLRVPAYMPVLIRNDGIIIPLHRIPGSDLLWIKLLQGDAAPVVKPQLGVVPADPKIQAAASSVVTQICAAVTQSWDDSEVAYYLEQAWDSEETDAAATNFERDAIVPPGPDSQTSVRLIAALAQRHTADLAGIPDEELVSQAGPVLRFCEKFLPSLGGIEPGIWLHDLMGAGQKAYLCRCALAVLKHSTSSPEARAALGAFHAAAQNVSADAANIIQLVSGEFLSELRGGRFI